MESHTSDPRGLVLTVAAAAAALVVVPIGIVRASALMSQKNLAFKPKSQGAPRPSSRAGACVSEEPEDVPADPVSEDPACASTPEAPEKVEDSSKVSDGWARAITVPVLLFGVVLAFSQGFKTVIGLTASPDDLPLTAARSVALAAGAVLVAVSVDLFTLRWSWLTPPAKVLNFFAALLSLLAALLVVAVTR